MYTTTMGPPDPQRFMHQFLSWEVATKDNKWSGRNVTRWRNEEYDRLWKAAETEMDPVEAGRPLHPDERPADPERRRDPGALAGARGGRLQQARNTEQSPWESDFWNHANWYREA